MNKDYIDLHSHVLWGVDDGSRSINESVDMCALAEDSGTGTLFLTPHLMYWDRAEELFDIRNEKTEYLKEVLADNDIELDLKTGFEILCDDDIFLTKYFNPYTLCGSKYILIEFDFFKTTLEDVLSWCSYLQSFGLVPIIAHPERYRFMLLDGKCVDVLSDKGILFQINAGSPAGMFGDTTAEFALKMIKGGFVDFIGSDAHDIRARNTDMAFCFDNYPYEADNGFLYRASYLNPLKVIQHEDVSVQRLSYFSDL